MSLRTHIYIYIYIYIRQPTFAGKCVKENQVTGGTIRQKKYKLSTAGFRVQG